MNDPQQTTTDLSWLVGRIALISIPLAVFFVSLFTFTSSDDDSSRGVDAREQYLVMIAEAIEQYRQDNGHYPPAWELDQDGNRTHSWRALILPHFEGFKWVDYDFKEPWNSEHNLAIDFSSNDQEALHSRRPYYAHYAYSSGKLVPANETAVFALVTPDSVWIDEPGGRVPLVSTLIVMEGNEFVHWATPRDIELPHDQTKLPPGLPKITPKFRGRGVFTVVDDVNSRYQRHKIDVRKYHVQSIDELLTLANASRAVERDGNPDQE